VRQHTAVEYGSEDGDEMEDGEVPRSRTPFPLPPLPLSPASVRADAVRSPLARRSISPLPPGDLPTLLKVTASRQSVSQGGAAVPYGNISMTGKASNVSFAADVEEDSSVMLPRPPPVAQLRPQSPGLSSLFASVADEAPPSLRETSHVLQQQSLAPVNKQERVKKATLSGPVTQTEHPNTDRRPRVNSMPAQPPLKTQDPKIVTSEVGKSPKGVTETANEAVEKNSVMKYERYKPLYADDQIPGGNSDHSVPVLHSSKLMAIQLEKLDEKIENDEFTVSTIETSSTMRLKAAQRAVNINPKSALYNYAELGHVDGTERVGKAERRFNVPKQVDQDWLSRKQNFSLSDEDKKILYPPDPLVHIKLQFVPSSPSGATKTDTSGITSYIHVSFLHTHRYRTCTLQGA